MRRLLAPLVIVVLAGAACGRSQQPDVAKPELHLGYFPNLTHAAAVAGVRTGIFGRALGDAARLRTSTFNAGPSAIEALLSGALDASYIGPNPAVNAYAKSNGEAVRVIAGATSGGAFFVVRPQIRSVGDLRGRRVASPQLGNTQDVALRSWLSGQGLRPDKDVTVVPQENAQTLETFRSGAVQGAWVPEPWATRLVTEGGGRVLVDERSLWPNGKYVTTLLVVRTAFLRQHPELVERLLAGHVEATAFVNDHPTRAQGAVIDGIAAITGKRLDAGLVAAAWRNLSFGADPLADSLRKIAADATKLGFLDPVDLGRIWDVSPLNAVLRARHLPVVTL